MLATPITLLERLRRPGEQAAWERFVQLYTPLLYHWARRLAPQEADAADLVQEVFVVLLRELPTFNYQPPRRFRGWLWTVLVNKWRERGRRRAGRPAEIGGDALDQQVEPDAGPALEEEEYRQYLVGRALQLMQADFELATWKASWAYVVEGRPAAAIAAELGPSVNAVHLAKARVLRRLRQELEGLLE
jgi:RNA polymerase sigma-70 factor (ECF subfamily)